MCFLHDILIICECDNIVKVSYGLSSECDIVYMFVIDHKVGWAWFANVNPLAIIDNVWMALPLSWCLTLAL